MVFVLAALVLPLANPRSALSAQSGAIDCDPAEGPPFDHRFNPIGFVFLDTGDYTFGVVDVGDTTELARTFTRVYSSLETRTTLLGPAWMDSFEVRLRRDSTTDQAIFTAPDGRVERFEHGLSRERTAGMHKPSRVLTRQDAGWTVTDERTIWVFNEGGSLVRVDDGMGDWAELRYNGSLASTSGPHGPGLVFDVGEDDRLAEVADAADPTDFVHYTYDEVGRLINVGSARSGVTSYAYEGDSLRLATISDSQNAIVMSIDYDDRGRVAHLKDAEGLLDGESESFVYEDLADGGIRTTVTYPTSKSEPGWHPVEVTTHDAEHRVREITTQPHSNETYIGRYDYDIEDRLIVVQDPCPPPPAREPADGSSATPLGGPTAVFASLLSQVLWIFTALINLLLALPALIRG